MKKSLVPLLRNTCSTNWRHYQLEFDPISAMALINNSTSLAGLETNAVLMLDSARPADDELGRFGRVTNISQVEATLNTQTDIVYNTASMSGEFITIYPKPKVR